jgi:multidrug efflux pump
LISAFVSLTLTPVLAVKFTRKDPHKRSWFYTKTEPFFQWMESGYQNSLTRFMKVRWMAFVIIAACGAAIFLIGSKLPSELAPMEDRSQFRLQVSAPEGTSFDAMDKYIDRLNKLMLDSVPEKRSYYQLLLLDSPVQVPPIPALSGLLWWIQGKRQIAKRDRGNGKPQFTTL